MPGMQQGAAPDYRGAAPLILPTDEIGVQIRELASDADDLAYFEAVESSREHLSRHGNATSIKYKTLEDVRQARINAGDKLRLGIWGSDTLVGSIIARPDDLYSEVEIGCWLREDATGRGYATLAVRALTPYLQRKYLRVFAEVHADNHGSMAVLRRSDYRKTAEVKRRWGPAVIFDARKS